MPGRSDGTRSAGRSITSCMSTMWPTTSRVRHSVHGDGPSQSAGVDGAHELLEAVGATLVPLGHVGEQLGQAVEARVAGLHALGHRGGQRLLA